MLMCMFVVCKKISIFRQLIWQSAACVASTSYLFMVTLRLITKTSFTPMRKRHISLIRFTISSSDVEPGKPVMRICRGRSRDIFQHRLSSHKYKPVSNAVILQVSRSLLRQYCLSRILCPLSFSSQGFSVFLEKMGHS